MIVSIVLIVLFGGFIAYEKSPNIHNGVNMIFGIKDNVFPITEQIRVDVLTDKSLTEVPYDYNEQLDKIREEFNMDIIVTEVDVNDEKGQKYVTDLDLASIPVFLFEERLGETKLYEETADFYTKAGDKYYLQLMPFKYLKLPSYDTGQVKGAENAKVTIVEYSSLSCGYCGKMNPVLAELLAAYPNDVRLIYKHYNRGGLDMLLENATECAGEQGKFWEMHDYIFDNQADLQSKDPAEFLNTASAKLGLTAEQFSNCVAGEKYAQTINDQTAEGFKFGVTGTPSFFVNDIFIGGAVSLETLQEAVDSLIQ